MAESGEQNLNSDLPGLRRSHLYIFNHQWLIWFISNSSYFQFHPNRSQSNPTFVLVQIEIHYKMFIIRWWRKKKKVPLQVITWPRVAMDLIWEPQNLRREKDYYKEKGPNEAAYIVIYTYRARSLCFLFCGPAHTRTKSRQRHAISGWYGLQLYFTRLNCSVVLFVKLFLLFNFFYYTCFDSLSKNTKSTHSLWHVCKLKNLFLSPD